MSLNLRVLQVEDSESDAAIVIRALEKAGHTVTWRRVEDAVEMREALTDQVWDVILSDYHLPSFDAPGALRIARAAAHDIPFLVVSGAAGEEAAVAMMKAGAHDYVMKNNLARLVPAVEREIRECHHRRELAQQRSVLDRQANLLNLSRDAIITADSTRVIESWNRGAEEIYGWARTEAVGKSIPILLHTSAAVPYSEIDRELRQEEHWEGELTHTRRDGRQVVVESRQVLVRDALGLPVGILEINRDITERRRLGERLRETQKAETMGVLAAGLAHNFHNLLTVVLGNAKLLQQNYEIDPAARALLDDAISAAQSAAELTRQILAYAGKGAVVRVPTCASEVAESITEVLRHSIPANIQLQTELAGDLPSVMTDPQQLRQALMNLLLNAAESINAPEGGTVSITTDFRDGRLWIEVCDTGCGMDHETQSRAFDPFFTTKEFGRGLGLSAAQGIVRSLGGEIHIHSTLGVGTCAQVALPV